MEWGPILIGAVSALAAIGGVLLGWTARARDIKHEAKAEGGTSAALRADVEYIKRGVDDIRADVRAQGQRMDTMAERLTRVEESSKQAHKRIDRLEVVERGADN